MHEQKRGLKARVIDIEYMMLHAVFCKQRHTRGILAISRRVSQVGGRGGVRVGGSSLRGKASLGDPQD